MKIILRLLLLAILSAFFAVGTSPVPPDSALAGAQVCKTGPSTAYGCPPCGSSAYSCITSYTCTSCTNYAGGTCNRCYGNNCGGSGGVVWNCSSNGCPGYQVYGAGYNGCTYGSDGTCYAPACSVCTGGQPCYGTCYSCNSPCTVNTTTCNLLPDAPILSAPPNGSNSFSATRTLSWSATDPDNGPSTPLYFEVSVQIPGSGSFDDVCHFEDAPVCPRGASGVTTSTTYTPTRVGTYSWRVRAWDGWKDNSGARIASSYSTVWTFVYNNVSPDTPTLISPINGSYALGQALLQWTSRDPDSGPNPYLDYELVIRSADGVYNGGFSFFTGHTGANNQTVSYNLAPQKGGTFFWKVRARDGWTDSFGNQVTSAYSEERTVFIDYNCP
jgi:hypothetical protein